MEYTEEDFTNEELRYINFMVRKLAQAYVDQLPLLPLSSEQFEREPFIEWAKDNASKVAFSNEIDNQGIPWDKVWYVLSISSEPLGRLLREKGLMIKRGQERSPETYFDNYEEEECEEDIKPRKPSLEQTDAEFERECRRILGSYFN